MTLFTALIASLLANNCVVFKPVKVHTGEKAPFLIISSEQAISIKEKKIITRKAFANAHVQRRQQLERQRHPSLKAQ